jgi:hypothetical protein
MGCQGAQAKAAAIGALLLLLYAAQMREPAIDASSHTLISFFDSHIMKL